MAPKINPWIPRRYNLVTTRKRNALRWGARTSNPARGVRRLWWVRLPLFSATYCCRLRACITGRISGSLRFLQLQ